MTTADEWEMRALRAEAEAATLRLKLAEAVAEIAARSLDIGQMVPAARAAILDTLRDQQGVKTQDVLYATQKASGLEAHTCRQILRDLEAHGIVSWSQGKANAKRWTLTEAGRKAR